jgi:hypothetical protein
MTTLDLITREDLEKFKQELFAELRKMSMVASPEQEAKKWLKSSEVRKLLKISPGTLQNLRINGTIKYTIVGSLHYYKYDDLVKLLNGTPEKKLGR